MGGRVPWWRLRHMDESDRGHSWLVKALIVMIAFPTVLLALMQAWKLVLFSLAWLLPRERLWAQWIGWSAALIGLAVALFGAFATCRLGWPSSRKSSTGSDQL